MENIRTLEFKKLLKTCKPGTAALKFDLEAGLFHRRTIRREMNSSIETFIDNKVYATCTEEKRFFSSTFKFRAINIPESMIEDVKAWQERIELISNGELI